MSGFKQYGPAILWAVVILTVSSIPGDELDMIPPIFGIDKLAHMVLYGVLGVLAARGWAPPRSGASTGVAWIVLLVCVGYGIVDELHQHLIPGRMPSSWDALADSIGATLGVFGYRSVAIRRRNRLNPTS